MKMNPVCIKVIFAMTILVVISCDNNPYELKDGYMYVQKEERRNQSTDWQLVWEDDFTTGSLDTTTWSTSGPDQFPVLKNFRSA